MSQGALVLSDLHLREESNDPRYLIFLEILKKFEESSLDELILMGDIFDILIGPKKFWFKVHKNFFVSLQRILQKKKKVTWVQGNHDFQLGSLLRPLGIHWIDESEVLERENVRIFIAHGDLADWTDKLHPFWRAFLTSRLLAFLIWLIPSAFAENVVYPYTQKLSQASRKVSLKRDRVEKARGIFRNYADRKSQESGAKLVLLGHSHIPDDYALSDNSRYLNFGSWFEEPVVGILHFDDSTIESKVFKASAWLHSTSK